jgi:hypothetical protein
MRSPAFRARRASGIDIYDPSLVLYLPFADHDMAGSTIISKDLNAHSCTVTGATWGSQGRSFDSTYDDFISVPDSPSLNLTVAQGFTIITVV